MVGSCQVQVIRVPSIIQIVPERHALCFPEPFYCDEASFPMTKSMILMCFSMALGGHSTFSLPSSRNGAGPRSYPCFLALSSTARDPTTRKNLPFSRYSSDGAYFLREHAIGQFRRRAQAWGLRASERAARCATRDGALASKYVGE